jgi:hypothetical protein
MQTHPHFSFTRSYTLNFSWFKDKSDAAVFGSYTDLKLYILWIFHSLAKFVLSVALIAQSKFWDLNTDKVSEILQIWNYVM